MKNCQSIEKNLTAYLHGELNVAEVQTVEKHLEACPACRAEFEAQCATLALLDEALMSAPAPERIALPAVAAVIDSTIEPSVDPAADPDAEPEPVWVKAGPRRSPQLPLF